MGMSDHGVSHDQTGHGVNSRGQEAKGAHAQLAKPKMMRRGGKKSAKTYRKG